MKLTETEVRAIAIKTLNDIGFRYDKNGGIEKIWSEKDHELMRGNNKGKIIEAWAVSIEFGEEVFGENRTAFLTIDDESGKAIYLQTPHLVTELDTDENGNAIRK